MTTSAIVISIVVALAVAQIIAVSPWLARRTVRLAARLRYGDTDRGRIRAEDLAAYVDTCPGPLLNLGAALCFLAVGSVVFAHRRSRDLTERIFAFVRAESARSTNRFRRRSYFAPAVTIISGGTTITNLITTVVSQGPGKMLADLSIGITILAVIMAGYLIARRAVAGLRRPSSGPPRRRPRA